MLNRKTLGVVGGVFALLIATAQPVLAQDYGQDRAAEAARAEQDRTGRIARDPEAARREAQREERERRRRPQPPAAPTAEQIQAEAQALLTATGQQCQMTEAINPGLINEAKVFEVACANAAGRILIATAPAQVFDCLELAGSAIIARQMDPAADVGQQCTLPANQNAVAVIGGFAAEAGVSCNIDEAVVIGKAGENMVYEIGCAGVDGYRLERQPTGWSVVDCLQVASTGQTCRFTTAAEQNATLKARLEGTEAAGCDVVQAVLMGQNANGRFFEVKCAAENEGYIARIKDGTTQQIYPCATARQMRIGNGCSLTPSLPPTE